MIRQTKLILGTNPGDIAYLNKRFTLGKFVGWALGGWGLKDWLLPSVFIGRGDGPDFDNIVRNTLKSSSAIEKVNWFDSHFACYTEWFVEHWPGFFDSRYRYEMGAKTILASKYPIKDFPIMDQRSWRSPRLPDLLESPYPEHTFQFGGPILLNTEARRAERIEQEWHGKDGSLIDVQPLNVATDSHTEVAVVGNMKVYNGVWQGPRDSWKRDSAKPELTAPFHSPVWYRNIFISKNADQPSEHFGDNVSAETHQECMKEHIEFTSKFHKEYTWW
jgi:hypothetical protein|uniref:Uncharacterized protein n=1 Tax=Eutreptiella gymnastica TaxID=73025 RepID=A0A7S4GCW3_9EUGL|mmetsp:Transcript_44604/g.72622  ORF Transcript_44604/g.72622 Transcript_44604/m.72622 type:complete len:275 (+) Transcript_44604:360-1184(+)